MSVAIVVTDVGRDEKTLGRIVLMLLLVGGVQVLIGLALYILNSDTAERLLNILSRFGYPSGSVLRYIDDDPTLPARAIGTWVDPNADGGFLMMVGGPAGAQNLARGPDVPRAL